MKNHIIHHPSQVLKQQKKRPAINYAGSTMSLQEKLEMWKSKNDVKAPLTLNHVEQKQLSSKFNHALK